MKNRMYTLACVMALSLSGISFAAQQAAGAGADNNLAHQLALQVAQKQKEEVVLYEQAKKRYLKDMSKQTNMIDINKTISCAAKKSILTRNTKEALEKIFDSTFDKQLAFVKGAESYRNYCRFLQNLLDYEWQQKIYKSNTNNASIRLKLNKFFAECNERNKKNIEAHKKKYGLPTEAEIAELSKQKKQKEKSAAQLKHEEEMRLAAERKAKEKAERAEKHKRLEEAAQAEKARRKAEKDALKKAQAEEDARAKQESEALKAEVELLRECRQQQVDDFERERREKLAQIEAEKERALAAAQAEVESSGAAALLAAEQAKREEAEAAHAKLVKRIEGLREQLAGKSKEIDLLGQQTVANTAQALQEREALQSKLQAEKTALMQNIADMDTQIQKGRAFYKRAKRRENLLKTANAQLQQATAVQADMLAMQGNVLAVQTATVMQQQQRLAQFKPVAAVKDGVVVPVYVAPAHAYVVPPVNALMAPTSK